MSALLRRRRTGRTSRYGGDGRGARGLGFDMHHRIVQRTSRRGARTGGMPATSRLVPPRSPPHAAVLFELVDQGVDRAGLHRVAADQQRMEAEGLAQVLVLHVRSGHRIDRSPRLVFHQCRRGADHAGEIQERHRAQLDVAFLVDRRRIFEERVVAGDVGRIEPGDLAAERGLVVRVVEVGAVGPVEPVERHDRHQLDVGGHVVPGQRP